MDQVYGAKIIILDNICTYKNWDNYHRLLCNTNYKLIKQSLTLRNCYSIFVRIDYLSVFQPPIKTVEKQPIHFFTIVLNGKPFIKYHINIFKQLPCQWHWHIVEGVAQLNHDTAWSLDTGGEILSHIHHEGRSVDGTTEYLEQSRQ